MSLNSGQRTSSKVKRRHGCAHGPKAQQLAADHQQQVMDSYRKKMQEISNG